MPLILALDQGTSSSRCVAFNSQTWNIEASHQYELKQQFPKEGWVEMDPEEILKSVRVCLESVRNQLVSNGLENQVKILGITNQRETSIAWDRKSGKPLYKAIVWLDGRTSSLSANFIAKTPSKSKDALRNACGLPIHAYFSALKFRWLLDNVDQVRNAFRNGNCLLGTVDAFLLWHLTGGPKGGLHITDVTNASRTLLMNINTLNWDQGLCDFFGIPTNLLPGIRSSAEIYAEISEEWPFGGLPIGGCVGDQQAAMIGHNCLQSGDAKNTYGTGCFILLNTGHKVVQSKNGMLTTVGYKLGPGGKAVYALEGSVAVAGGIASYLRDNLGIVEDLEGLERMASEGRSDVYFVPAFSGLFAPHWDSEARGLIIGLTQYTESKHLVRAALESVCLQTVDVIEAMEKDCAMAVNQLKCDGGMSKNNLLLQLQADFLKMPVLRPQSVEATSKGAAMLAFHALLAENPEETAGFSPFLDNKVIESKHDVFEPKLDDAERERIRKNWIRAVDRAKGWLGKMDKNVAKIENSIWDSLQLPVLFFVTGCAAGFLISKFSRKL